MDTTFGPLLDRTLHTSSRRGSQLIISRARRVAKWRVSSPYSLESGRVVFRHRCGLAWGASCPCCINTAPGGPGRARRFAPYPGPTTDQRRYSGRAVSPSARQDVAVLLDVSELEVHKIHLIVKDLRSYASMLLELVSLVNLKLRLGNARHPRPLPRHGGGARGDPRGPHPDEVLTGTRGNAVRARRTCLETWMCAARSTGRSRAGWRTSGRPSGRS